MTDLRYAAPDPRTCDQEVTCPTCQGAGTSGPSPIAPGGVGTCGTCRGRKKVSRQRADFENSKPSRRGAR